MCTVCSHPRRLEIERDLLACPSAAAVAACHHLPLEEVKQHKARLQARIDHAQQQLEQMQVADSLARLNILLEKTMKILAAAEDNGDQKLMLQAVREAERLTKLIHSFAREQEAVSLFMDTTDPGWPQTGSTPDIQARTRQEVRQAIKQSLSTPCADRHLEAELPPEPASVPAKPVPAVRKGQAFRRPQVLRVHKPTDLGAATVLPTVTDLGTANALEIALPSVDSLAAARYNRAGPN
jgi:hypothetical protein